MKKNNTEIWKDVVGFEGLYKVSNLGRIRSVERKVIYNNGHVHHYKGNARKPYKNKRDGYWYVTFKKNNKTYGKKLHRIILQAFVGECPDGMEGCHKNDNKDINTLENLRWDTHINNCKDRIKNGKQHISNKLSVVQVKLIKWLLNLKIFTHAQISEMFPVQRTVVSRINTGKLWAKTGCF